VEKAGSLFKALCIHKMLAIAARTHIWRSNV
jgi:hypothetical protein